jgi:hypothetical protein
MHQTRFGLNLCRPSMILSAMHSGITFDVLQHLASPDLSVGSTVVGPDAFKSTLCLLEFNESMLKGYKNMFVNEVRV